MIPTILRYFAISSLTCTALATTSLAQADLTARDIVAKVISQSESKYFSADVTMDLIDGSGNKRQRLFKLRSLNKDGYRASLSNFTKPFDVKNTGFLTINQDAKPDASGRWMYIPSVGKTKKIPQAESHKKFMASDFSYADLEQIKLDRNRYKILKTLDMNGEATWAIEVIPADQAEAERSGYKKSVLYVNQKRFTVTRSAHWLNGGKNVKLMRVLKEENIGGKWLATKVKMTSKSGKKTLHQTIISFDAVDTKTPLADSFFTTRRLEKGH